MWRPRRLSVKLGIVAIFMTTTMINEKKRSERRKHCALVVVRRSQKFSPAADPPVSSLVQQRRLKLFGHVARAAASEDHSRALRASTDRLPVDWRRSRGRPRQSWLRTIDSDLKPLNLGLHSALRRAKDRLPGDASWKRLCSSRVPPDDDLFPGARDGQNLISWRWSLPLPTNPVWWESMHAISSCHGNRPTNTPTNRQDRLQYTALQLARSVIIFISSAVTHKSHDSSHADGWFGLTGFSVHIMPSVMLNEVLRVL